MQGSRILPFKLPHIECQKGGDHEGQFLTNICTEKLCNSALCCSICLHESHSGHKTNPIKIVLKQAIENSEKFKHVDSDVTMIKERIEKCRSTVIETLAQERQRLNSVFLKAQQTAEETLKNTEAVISFMQANSDQLTMQIQGVKSHSQFQQLICSIGRAGLNQNQPIEPGRHLNELEQKCHQIVTDFKETTSNLNTLLQGVQQNIQKLSQLDFESSHHLTQAFFSVHHPQIVLQSATEAFYGGSASFYKIALIQPLLNDGVYKFKISISNTSIAVGICSLKVVSGNNLSVQDYKKCGHGFWGIYGSKLVFSHSDSQYNYKQLAFELRHTLPVEMLVNKKRNFLKFSQGDKTFEMPFTLEMGEEIHAAIMVVLPNSHVKLHVS